MVFENYMIQKMSTARMLCEMGCDRGPGSLPTEAFSHHSLKEAGGEPAPEAA